MQILNDSTILIKSLFEDNKKVKIFHDCRKDSTALHFLLNTCFRNAFDTSIVHQLIQ